MSRKRKEDDSVDREEFVNLTKVAKSWDFTCTFCFKRFDSAQAMGGHQNAHRNERLEEKRLHIKDPIGHRKRAFLRSIKSNGGSSSAAAVSDSNIQAHAANSTKGGCPSKANVTTKFNAGYDGKNNNPGNPKSEAGFVANNTLELSLGAGAVTVSSFKIHNLDLTLKL